MLNDLSFDQEWKVTQNVAKYLDSEGWSVVACHPPGGHTSFSILSGRRSKGSYMPDIVAYKFDPELGDYIVIIAESKPNFSQSAKDIQKLLKLDDNHANWVAFRMQNHINSQKWLKNWRQKLQKVICYAYGIPILENIPDDVMLIQAKEGAIKISAKAKAPAKALLKG